MKHKAWYFRVLGVIETIGFVVGLIGWIIYMVWHASVTTGNGIALDFLILFLIIFFGPSYAWLLFGHADLLEKAYPEDNKSTYLYEEREEDAPFKVNEAVKTTTKLKAERQNVLIPMGQKGIVIEPYKSNSFVSFVIDGEMVKILISNKHLVSLEKEEE